MPKTAYALPNPPVEVAQENGGVTPVLELQAPAAAARSSVRGYSRVLTDELPFAGVSFADIRALPKIDLHRHLVGAIRPEVLLRTAHARHLTLPLGSDVHQVRSKLVLRDPGSCNYGTFLRKRIWGEFKHILGTERGCANAVFWAVADAHSDGVVYVEFRVSPYGIGPDQPMTLSQFLGGVRRGLEIARQHFPSTIAKLVLSLGRRAVVERWPHELRRTFFAATVKAASDNHDMIVGLDLAGDEDHYPNRHFVEYAELAKGRNIPLTVHAGETGRPESVWEALEELKADRIGHGIAASKDATLMRRLARDRTPLEVCYTSNYILGVVPPFIEHPFAHLNASGVFVTVNTDDPVIFDETTLSREYYSLLRANQLSQDDLMPLVRRSAEASFLRGKERDELLERLRSFPGLA
jgi:adenosine deaminase